MVKIPPSSLVEKTDSDTLNIFKKVPAFKGISSDTLSKLIEGASHRLVHRGEFIFNQSDPASSLVILTKGMAVELKHYEEVDCLVSMHGEPALFGEDSFLESCCRSTSLFANEDCSITEIDNKCLEHLASLNYDEFESLFLNLGRELGKKVLHVSEKLKQAHRNPFIRESTIRWNKY